MLLVCNNLAPLLHPDLLIGGTAPSNLSPFVSLYFVISRYSLMVVKLLYSRVFLHSTHVDVSSKRPPHSQTDPICLAGLPTVITF